MNGAESEQNNAEQVVSLPPSTSSAPRPAPTNVRRQHPEWSPLPMQRLQRAIRA